MGKKLKRVVAASAATALGLALAACGGDSNDGDGGSGNNNAEPGQAGGELNYLQHFLFEAADPQRIYYGVQLANWRRTVYRGLTAFPMSEDPKVSNTPVADLATDTGTMTDGGKTWAFTLKDGVKWEDGSDITCEDVQYGASRPFANDVITGGPNYTLSYIDVPQKADGTSTYPGPYKATPEQQKQFEDAVSCDGKTITFRFNKPWVDFNAAIAGLMMVDPYKKSADKGDKSKWNVLSNGPYKFVGGKFDQAKGGTLVRNENYDPATDDPEQLRLALPDQINWKVNDSDTAGETFNDQLIEDSPDVQNAITTARLAPQQLLKVQSGEPKERYTNVVSPYTDYLVVNAKTVTDPKVRRAIGLSADINGFIKALGGELVSEPADSIINPGVTGYTTNPAWADRNLDGDVEAAKALLQEAGVNGKVKLKVAYQKSPTYDKAFSVLQESWNKAGFDVTLDGQGATYYDVLASPDKDIDIAWAGWGADWPSVMTVLPPLFDSRPNISSTSCNNDYGCYESDAFNKLIDEAANAASVDEQIAKLQEADALLGEDVGYIPLDNQKFNWMHGSKVTGFTTTAASSSYPELGLIGVKQ